MQLEITVTAGPWKGRVVVDSLEAARREFGEDFDPDSATDYIPKTISFEAEGCDVFQYFDNLTMELAMVAETPEQAMVAAIRLNEKHPDLK